ncbi:MAG: DUF4142 domain-containing protein [Thermoanaerobaculia bacterium]
MSRPLSLFLIAVILLTSAVACNGGATMSEQRRRTAATTRKKAPPPPSSLDRQFLVGAARFGVAQIDLARIGLMSSTDPDVRQLARTMLDSYQSFDSELRELATRKHVPLPLTPAADVASQIEEVKTLRSDGFDRRFTELVAKTHQTESISFDEGINRLQDADVRNFAATNLPVIQDVQAKAERLAPKFGGSV